MNSPRWTAHELDITAQVRRVGVWDAETRAWVWGRRGHVETSLPRHKRSAESIALALNTGRLRALPADPLILWIAPPPSTPIA